MRNWFRYWWACCRVLAWAPPEGVRCLVCIDPRRLYLGVTLNRCCVNVSAVIRQGDAIDGPPRMVLTVAAEEVRREYDRRHPKAGHVLDTAAIGRDEP